MKIADINAVLAGNPTEEQLQAIRQDERAGVQKLLAAYDKKLPAKCRLFCCRKCCCKKSDAGSTIKKERTCFCYIYDVFNA